MPYPVQPIPLEPGQATPVAAPTNPPTPTRSPEVTWSQGCFGYPSGLYLFPAPRLAIGYASPATPRTTTSGSNVSSSGSGGSGSVGGGGGDGKALLVIVALALVALPVVLYALDDEAPPVVQQRFGCPSFHLDLQSGVESAAAFPGARFYGQGRVTMAMSYFGTDVQFDLSPTVANAFAAHALLRLFPRKHVEGAVAVGYRRLMLDGQVREGFDVGLPHRYAFWRDDLRLFGLELRPSFLFGPAGVDVAIEAALIAPVFELLHLRLGGRVYSAGGAIVLGASAGLTLGI
jgi:hypothetical protein